MSLAEGLLLDNLLQNVETHDVYVALRSDIKDDPTRLGAGTAEDPYDGSKTSLGVCKLDTILSAVLAGSCVRLGPGTFWTNGTAGYSIPDGIRIVGQGREVTTVKLNTGGGSFAFGTAVSGATSPLQRTGVQIAELCVDCNQIGGAIAITGVNNLFRQLRFINYAPSVASTAQTVVELANSAAGRIAQNCVLDDCIFEIPGTFASSSSATLVELLGVYSSPNYYPHQFCVVRRCVMDGGSATNPVTGIDFGLGRGFIAEENQMFNIQTGIYSTRAPAIDVILWNNEFNVVQTGVSLTYSSSAPRFGRVVILDNVFALQRGVASIGIQISGSGSGQFFDQAIIRKNIIAADAASSGSTSLLSGMNIFNVNNAIVENNLISDCENAVSDPLEYQNCSTFKAFNNQNSAGTLLRAYEGIAGRFLMELEDFVQDTLIAF